MKAKIARPTTIPAGSWLFATGGLVCDPQQTKVELPFEYKRTDYNSGLMIGVVTFPSGRKATLKVDTFSGN